MRRTALCAAALTLSTAATAHTFWLQPSVHSATSGEDVSVAFRLGDAGKESDWALHWERVASLRLYGPDRVIDQLATIRPTGPDERGGALITAPAAPGSYILGFESNPSLSDLKAEPFNEYLAHEGLSAVAAHRQAIGAMGANGTESYARRAKALLQVGDAKTANVTQPIGQTLEIVPLANPFTLAAGDALDVQVLWRGAPLEGAQVAVIRPDAKHQAELLKTDAAGKARFALKLGSRYIVSVVWSVPAPNDKQSNYMTIFSSLTFSSPD
ncbi:MAG: DUF4198 domain-containing protein [Erythrobacter sp.]